MQQFSATRTRLPLGAPFLLGGLLSLLLAGCHKEEFSAFSAPKEPSNSAAPKTLSPAPAGPRAIHWTTPTGWEEQPAGGMRVGSFSVNKDGKHADVSIIPLGGVSGGELANVNRWRGQVGLPPIDQAKLGESGEKVSIASTPAKLFDMAGTDPQTKQPTRILAADLSAEGTTWFFKMYGPEDLVAQEKPDFKKFLESIQFQEAPGGALPPEHPPLMGATTQDLSAMAAPAASADAKPVWQVPSGWQEQPASSMRLASYTVTGEKGAKAEVSVIKLAGMAGGLLPNVNRWRAQVGLQPVDEAGLKELISTHDVKGSQVTLVDMAGPSVESGTPSRLLAAIVPRSGMTWFYKMLGNDELVAQQKAAFIQFVDSAKYPNAS